MKSLRNHEGWCWCLIRTSGCSKKQKKIKWKIIKMRMRSWFSLLIFCKSVSQQMYISYSGNSSKIMRCFHLFLFLSTDLHTSHVNVILFYFFHSRWCMTQTLDFTLEPGVYILCRLVFNIYFNLYFFKYIFCCLGVLSLEFDPGDLEFLSYVVSLVFLYYFLYCF